MTERAGLRRPGIAAGVALALQAVLFPWPATLAGEAFFRRDVHLMWHAQADVQSRAWAEGSRRVWNPSVSFGQPLVADANNQVFYPFSLLHGVWRPWTSYTWYVAAHLLLAGAGALFLGRRLGLAWLPAWAAAALWMGSGPLLSLADTWNQLAGAAWMPWAIAAGLRTLSGGGLRHALGWAAATAMQVLAGAPETAVLATAGLVVVGLALARRDRWTGWRLRRAALGTAVAAVFAVGLAACQWAPALDAARRAGRTELAREARVHWSVHPLHLAQVVCPLPLHRLALTPESRARLFGAPDPFLPSIYSGVIGAALLAAALARPSRVVIGLLAAAALAALGALGGHAGLYDLAVALAPPLRAFRYPAKALLLTSLAWCLLCGFGLAALSARRGRTAFAVIAASLALVSAAVAWSLVYGPAPLLERFLAASSVGAARPLGWRVAGAALLAALAAVLSTRPHARSAARAAAALAVLDLSLAHLDLNPTAPIALYTHRPAALSAALDPEGGRLFTWDYLDPGSSETHLGREIPYLLARGPVGWDARAAQALGLREALFPPTAAPWGAAGSYDRDVPGMEPASIAMLKEAFRVAAPGQRLRLLRVGAVSRVAALHAGAGEGLELLGRFDGYFVDPVLVFAVPDARPRAYVVGTARVAASDREALRLLLEPSFSPEREVVLASGVSAEAAGFEGSARVLDRRVDRVSLETTTNGPGWAVLVDAWDPGWLVTVDSRPAPLQRANVAFRAVAVPEGRHRVEFVHRPSTVETATWVSVVSLVLLAGGVWLAMRRPFPGAP